MRPARRMKEIPPSSTLKVLRLAKELERSGRRILHLQVGEPDFDTPDHIKRAGEEAIRRGMTKYTPSPGLPQLREKIAERLGEEKGIDLKPDNVIITPGAKHAIFCALVATLDSGDEVIIPSPCWTYEAMVKIAGGRPVFLPTREEDGFVPEPERIEEKITGRTRLILLNYPNNPTGAIIDRKSLEQIILIAKRHRLWILSDEIYDKLTYERKSSSALEFPDVFDRIIYINGFSKTYAMTGWRLGYAVAPEELISEMVKIQEATTSCVPGFVQMAGIAALDGPQDFVENMRREYWTRRDLAVYLLNSIEGVRCGKPGGAFYTFPNISEIGVPSLEFCERLLQEEGVAAVPGSGFGPGGEGHLRVSFATSPEVIREGVEKIKALAERIRREK